MTQRLIFIDDNLEEADSLRELLRKWKLDYEVISNNQSPKPVDDTPHGRSNFCNQIVEMVRANVNHSTDAIFLDVLFEHGSGGAQSENPLGYTLGAQLRRHFPTVPIVLYTVRGEQQDVMKAYYFFNFDGYVAKTELKVQTESTFFEAVLFRAKMKRQSVLNECEDLIRSETQKAYGKARVFVGSSAESIEYAFAIQQNLEHDRMEVTVWPQGIFQLSSTTLDDLIAQLDAFDFGVFVFSPDDTGKIRGVDYLEVRDNVIFELGLFMGSLGKEACFFIVPRDNENLRLPTDLLGIKPATFNPNREDGNLQAALGSACTEIRKAIHSLMPKPEA